MQPGIRHRVFIYWCVLWRTHQQDLSPTTSEKSAPTIHQYCCDGHDGVRFGPEVNLHSRREKIPLRWNATSQMAAACEAVVHFNGRLRGLGAFSANFQYDLSDMLFERQNSQIRQHVDAEEAHRNLTSPINERLNKHL